MQEIYHASNSVIIVMTVLYTIFNAMYVIAEYLYFRMI